MYNPPHFTETRPQQITALVQQHPLGTLVVAGPEGLDAHHLPFLYDPAAGPHGRLQAHVARANPLWRQRGDGTPVLVIFRGPAHYISPNWYPGKHETHRQVPTWNYQVVHLHGRLRVRDDVGFVRGVVARLTRTHEATAGNPQPWKMGDAPADYLDQMLAAIVGIEIEVERVEAKSKLGQNKEARDRRGPAQALDARGATALARAMREAPPALEP